MKQKDNAALSDAIAQILSLKGLTNAQERQIEGLKTVIKKIIDANPDDFASGLFLIEGVGMLKTAANPAKLLVNQTGQAPNDVETIGLLALIGDQYMKPTVNVVKVQAAVKGGNKKLITALKKAGVKLIQETRWDVKQLA